MPELRSRSCREAASFNDVSGRMGGQGAYDSSASPNNLGTRMDAESTGFGTGSLSSINVIGSSFPARRPGDGKTGVSTGVYGVLCRVNSGSSTLPLP